MLCKTGQVPNLYQLTRAGLRALYQVASLEEVRP